MREMTEDLSKLFAGVKNHFIEFDDLYVVNTVPTTWNLPINQSNTNIYNGVGLTLLGKLAQIFSSWSAYTTNA